MDAQSRPSIFRMFRQEAGSVALEFAIIVSAFLLLVFGIVDFGHAWYMEHIMSNASREGARYGTRYITDNNGQRLLPKNLAPSIANYINTSTQNGGWGLVDLLPSDANPTATPSGAGYTETNVSVLAGEDLKVTVTARKNWFVIGYLVPGLGTYKDLTVSTTMKCE